MMSTEAGSGHPTSSLSAADIMTSLFFGGHFRFDTNAIANPHNDRIIFSKGHASPLFYALWTAAGEIPEADLSTYRKFGSYLEGHPMPTFKMTEAATGSLGQGLSIGMGMALCAKYLDKTDACVYVLLGDSEMAEGSVWETMNIASHYKLNNLVGIIDINRLGQRGETMFGYDLEEYKNRVEAFGWQVLIVDGHLMEDINRAYDEAKQSTDKPVMILAKTIKGKGVSFLENQEGWHGKALDTNDFEKARLELGEIDTSLRGTFASIGTTRVEEDPVPSREVLHKIELQYKKDALVATRQVYGDALVAVGKYMPSIVALDAEVSNSTFADAFKKEFPERYFEMFIAEQNMVGNAVGLAKRGKIPFVSTFAAFFSRAFDQIRMAQYTQSNVKFVGSHCGVSIGEDGASQMGLEDIALFRSIFDSVVLYPADAVSAAKLIQEAAIHKGIVYIRTTRAATPVLYAASESFPIGGSKVLRRSDKDVVTLISAGITLFEALAVADEYAKQEIGVRVIDVYSVKPLDTKTLLDASRETKAIIAIEDHYQAGGIGEAVCLALAQESVSVHTLCVRKMPHSGTMAELLDYEEISRAAIRAKVQSLL
jgi:transketolase